MNRIILFFCLFFSLTACTSKFQKVLKNKDTDYKVKMAEQYFAEKKYSNAQQLFESVIPFVKGTPRYEELYLMYANSYYNDKDYENAENIYKTFIEYFPNSAKVEEVEFMRANTYYKRSPKAELDQTTTNKAMQLMQSFIDAHPTSPRVKEASEVIDACRAKLESKDFKTATLYYDLALYRAAAISYGLLSDYFPDATQADKYKLLTLKAYFKFAENSFYDKQKERFEKVVQEYNDFVDRYSDSPLLAEAKKIKKQTDQYLKNIK
ncbi:MAG: outer membrane protein assembly factor BamD [Bacteroidota bacterium]|jgi:outer membrane protein assembly factor BamD